MVWVANGASPVADAAASPELTVSAVGDLVVANQATNKINWSAQPAQAIAKNATVAVLLDSGNLVLLDASSSSAPRTLWQSFDHPTDTLLPSAKLGRNKATGVNRRLVSRKSSATPFPGPYCFEVDPDVPQLVLKLCDSSVAYWSTGAWSGKYFGNIPELAGNVPNFHLAFVDYGREEYLQFNVTTDGTVTRNIVDVTGQNKHQVWIDASQDWLTLYAGPKAQCDVYAACGAFTLCSYAAPQPCSCMKGFSLRSERGWEQGDRTGGCVRDAPEVKHLQLMEHGLINVRSSSECSTSCLNNRSCIAYSYGSQGCFVWLDGLINAKQTQSNGTSAISNVACLMLCLAVKRLDGSFQGEKQFRAEARTGSSSTCTCRTGPSTSTCSRATATAACSWTGAPGTRSPSESPGASPTSMRGCRDWIIHCDVKPQNILLDALLLPKIADFGMAKLVGRGFSRVLTTMRGTKGYLAPEWIGGTAVTAKVDVYNYGMVLLELVSGRRNSGAGEECYTTSESDGDHVAYFPMKAARELIEGDVRSLLDERLCGDANLKEVERACKVACWCIQDDEAHRPTMGEVVQMLEGVLDRDMPPLPRLLETMFARPQSSTQRMTTVSSTSVTFTSGSGSSQI
ncbi:hypothetical protein SETIT_5G110000v2 [Setaria italica]|uniref:non-specific serine/threonine protein kinase n=1 Tax=Setaria italica TaxID=4555 RepID=A0A368R3U7_SETIT|nr:hypothetical protein SETIT_5G110000v2 [Setaria italica]